MLTLTVAFRSFVEARRNQWKKSLLILRSVQNTCRRSVCIPQNFWMSDLAINVTATWPYSGNRGTRQRT